MATLIAEHDNASLPCGLASSPPGQARKSCAGAGASCGAAALKIS
jgi:hypothetical protein